MDAYTFRHFQNVARNMNNYLITSTYGYYSEYDRIPMAVYQPAFYPPAASLGNRFAGGLYSAGLGNLANIGYRFGDLIDRFV
jgi:hypothetical protein